MRNISPELSDHFAGGMTTLCRVFILNLRDERRFAFTDHDSPLQFDGVEAAPMQAADTELRSGFDADSGALRSVFALNLSREDILAGVLDGASLIEHRVNWQDTDQSVHVATGQLGEVSLNGDAFEADWLGQTVLLERSTGRVFSRRCDAEYGDERCGLTAEPGQSCPRTFEACKSFGNAVNFRGFPYLLGDDVLQKGVHLTPTRTGGSRYV